jgi:hypothetical protein
MPKNCSHLDYYVTSYSSRICLILEQIESVCVTNKEKVGGDQEKKMKHQDGNKKETRTNHKLARSL